MNVLILTPDAVGSTLLQRLITIYMQFHQFARPVINLHELTNGLHSFYSPDFNREIIGRSQQGYVQSLPDITDLLKKHDHYKVARLAQYHINSRQDTLDQQIPFYRYLDDNFFIIATRRQNVFEHALSWGINKITKKLNVYTPNEKINTFIDLYKSSVTLDKDTFVDSLESYKNYLQWCSNHFSVGAYFYYDRDTPNIENYILNLPIFAGQQKQVTWNDVYGIDFSTWNRCHFFTSNIETLAIDSNNQQLALTHTIQEQDNKLNFLQEYFNSAVCKDYQKVSGSSWPRINSIAEFENLPSEIKNECVNIHGLKHYKEYQSLKTSVACLPTAQIDFLENHFKKYSSASQSIDKMMDLGILPTPIPIKKQTLAAKKFMIKNFDQCVEIYNDWIASNPEIGSPINESKITQQITKEKEQWAATTGQDLLS
jgi:hypothetical protein